MAANVQSRGLRKPVFVKVESLKPGNQRPYTDCQSAQFQLWCCRKAAPSPPTYATPALLSALLATRLPPSSSLPATDQVDLVKPGTTVILRNAKIDMFKGSMRLAVDKWGRIEVTEPSTLVVKEDNNLSLIEYELVNVVEE
ncbi:Nucleic acid-binding [Forsythia ovata]|uniref:Nucleic acid-binding n=1 Tax=Forsythia ovata TaxID=205694 RepID=A0ABD1R5B8_9LAMI